MYRSTAVFAILGDILAEVLGGLLGGLLPHQPRSTVRGVFWLLLSLLIGALGVWASYWVIWDRPGWWWEWLAVVAWIVCLLTLIGSLQAFGLVPSNKHHKGL